MCIDCFFAFLLSDKNLTALSRDFFIKPCRGGTTPLGSRIPSPWTVGDAAETVGMAPEFSSILPDAPRKHPKAAWSRDRPQSDVDQLREVFEIENIK